jgi:membrane-associated protease RseP (regulator of RpoE activity)
VAVIALVGIFIGFPLLSPVPVLLAAGGALFFYVWRWHKADLLPTNPELVANARRSSRLLNLLSLLGILAE